MASASMPSLPPSQAQPPPDGSIFCGIEIFVKGTFWETSRCESRLILIKKIVPNEATRQGASFIFLEPGAGRSFEQRNIQNQLS